jgi:predicted CoA-substrate-specific enzyme activase
MYVAGLDVGAISVKAVILGDEGVVQAVVCETGISPRSSARSCLSTALEMAGIAHTDLARIVSTGHGRKAAGITEHTTSEITAVSRAAFSLSPGIPIVVDVGGQGIRVMRLSKTGGVEKFINNDKCSAGTGCFLDAIAGAMSVPLDDLGRLSDMSKSPSCMSTTCTIFAESEVISLIARGSRKEDIIAGLHRSVALKVANLVRSIGEGDVLVSGGVARNPGVVRALGESLGDGMKVAKHPHLFTAVGAAILAYESEGGVIA